MKKKILLILLPLLLSCSTSNTSSINENKDIYVSRIITSSKKNYLEVDGYPFIYNGIQIRTDWLINEQNETIDDMEYYFKIAQELGTKCVEIPLRWKDLEPKKDAYDFRNVSKYMSFAKKYNLRIEFLLFGINIGGMTGNVPDYIKKDEQTYPQYKNTLNHPDALFFVQDNKNTLSREKKCTEALMDAIYQWSISNKYNACISIQVRNEPDLYFPKVEQYSLKKENGENLSLQEAKNETLLAIKEIASTIKNSKYKVITRVNVCCYSQHPEENYELWNDILALGNIDIVGEDTYSPNIDFNKSIIERMNSNIVKNYATIPQIAENTGHYENNNSLFLMANMLGAGYNLYDMITPSVITDTWGYYDWGLLDNKTKKPKETFSNTQKALDGINLAGHLFATTPSEDIACFNIESNTSKKSINQTINTTKTTYSFQTDNNAIGYAINNNNYIYLFSDKSSTITISNTTLEDNIVQTGYVNEKGEFINNDSQTITNNTINLIGEKLYRIKASSLANLESTTISSIHSEVNNEN